MTGRVKNSTGKFVAFEIRSTLSGVGCWAPVSHAATV
jgi:hypothetical protein